MEERSVESSREAAGATSAAEWSAGDATRSETVAVSGKRRRRTTSQSSSSGTRRRVGQRRSTGESTERKASSTRRRTGDSDRTAREDKPKSTASRRKISTDRKKASSSRKTTTTTGGHESRTEPRRKTPKKEPSGKTESRKKTTKKASARKTTSKRKSSSRRGGLLDVIREILAGKLSGKENPILGPILEYLTKSRGLSADASQAVVAFAVEKLASGLVAGVGAPGAGSRGGVPAQSPGSGLDSFLERMTSEQRIDRELLVSTGLAGELSGQAGLDPELAADSLAETFNRLHGVSSEQMRAGSAVDP